MKNPFVLSCTVVYPQSTYKQLVLDWLEFEKKRGLVDVKVFSDWRMNQVFEAHGMPKPFPNATVPTEEEFCREFCDMLTAPEVPDPLLF